MTWNEEEFEQEQEKIRAKNQEEMDLFEEDLVASGLSDTTIENHLQNVHFFLDVYVLNYRMDPEDRPIEMVDSFLGDFFIRKCMWSTPKTIKSTAASFKKFFKSMVHHGRIEKKDYEALCQMIKEELPSWQAACEIYNDPSSEMPWVLF